MDLNHETQPTVLIIDAQREDVQLMHWVLRDEFNVVGAESVKSALPLLQSCSPAVVVLDIERFGSSSESQKSLEPLIQVLEHDWRCRLIVLGSNGGNSDLSQPLAEKTFGYFSKPLNFQLLRSVISRHAGKARRRSKR